MVSALGFGVFDLGIVLSWEGLHRFVFSFWGSIRGLYGIQGYAGF